MISNMFYERKLYKDSMAEPIPHVIRPLVCTHVYHPYFAADRQAETDVVTLRDALRIVLRAV